MGDASGRDSENEGYENQSLLAVESDNNENVLALMELSKPEKKAQPQLWQVLTQIRRMNQRNPR